MGKSRLFFAIVNAIFLIVIIILGFQIYKELKIVAFRSYESMVTLKELSQSHKDILTTTVPVSASGLDYYAQGGIVVNGTAYFTGDHGNRMVGDAYLKSQFFPYVVSFNVNTFKKIRTYNFRDTYDSAPLIIHKKRGTPLIIAHEYKLKRTKALNLNTGNTEWISKESEPGCYFFGYSYYLQSNGEVMVLVPSQNGLHALSGEDGEELWYVSTKKTGSITPCVDQANAIIYYQCIGRMLKIDAKTGRVMASKMVDYPNYCISWNTVFINDSNGYYIATYWFGNNDKWDSAIRVFDKNLNLVWERKSLPTGKKPTLTYAEGKIVIGTGNERSDKYFGDEWKYIQAYDVTNGHVVWKTDLSDFGFQAIYNVPYFNGYFYAETQDRPGFTSKLFRMRASDGTLESVLDYGRPILSCAPSIIAYGKMFSGDLWSDRIVVTRLAENSKANWEGPFANPQTNQYALPYEEAAAIVPMEEIKTD